MSKNITFDPKTGEIRSTSGGNNSGGGKKWYDRHFVIFILLVISIFTLPIPILLYALIQSNTIGTFWKWFWAIPAIIYGILVLSNL